MACDSYVRNEVQAMQQISDPSLLNTTHHHWYPALRPSYILIGAVRQHQRACKE